MKNSTSKLVFYYKNTVKKIFSRLKDVDPPEKQSSLIYKIDCKDCHSCYVGQTKQYLSNRIAQHKRDCRNGSESTALSSHSMSQNHNFKFDDVRILNKEPNWSKRNFKEMFYIHKIDNTVNSSTDTASLNVFYNNLIRKCWHLERLASPDSRDAFGIIVSYAVKVKLYLGALGGELVAELPFVLMHPKPTARGKILHAYSQADIEDFRQDTVDNGVAE